MKKDYFLGLDVGTSSVGWAVTDPFYNVIRKGGKSLWGVRLFDEAQTAANRRVFRASRRRLMRRNQRIALLQELFDQEISEKDPCFFQRLKDSSYWSEDKSLAQKNSLFADEEYADTDYHEDYPTIYHLRKSLIDGTAKNDIRLLYLALHHILKHRGHFLFEGLALKEAKFDFKLIFEEFCETLLDQLGIDWDSSLADKFKNLIKKEDLVKTAKDKALQELMECKEKQEKKLCGLLVGRKNNFSDLFNDESLKDAEIKGISFEAIDFDEKEDQYLSLLGEERFSVILKAKAIYDWMLLSNILRDKKYLSYAKVDVYEKHKKDLEILKRVLKKYKKDEYYKVFKADHKSNYAAYVGIRTKNGKKIRVEKKCKYEDFLKFVKAILGGISKEDAELEYLLDEIELKRLLPKQVISSNGVIPKQLHELELKLILDKAEKWAGFLKESDQYGTVSDKIKQLFNFRIPYYVGPLNDSHREQDEKLKQCWIIRKKKGAIRPWNFNEMVDVKQTAEVFITRMTSKCSYLIGEDVLPKDSLICREFMVLNELNNLKINNEKISISLRNQIFEDLFKGQNGKGLKQVTGKKIRTYLKSKGELEDRDSLSGIDNDFKSSLRSYLDFKSFLESKKLKVDDVEKIIRWIVLFGDDKNILKDRLNEFYSILSEEEQKQILKLKYKGWGRLSKTFLTKITSEYPKGTGKKLSILSALKEGRENLMQLLSQENGFSEAIEAFNEERVSIQKGFDFKMLDDFYLSAPVKRAVWQALLIIKEVKKIIGYEPKKIFLEMAREHGEKKRTLSRKNQLQDLYKKCKDEERDWVKELENYSDNDLRKNKLYLYYTQKGKCMYTGQQISLDQLFNKNIYDIDHIYPKSKVIDDSLDNRVLVLKSINGHKTDNYPIEAEIQEKMKKFWGLLVSQELISKKKYKRLIRKSGFSANELSDFISRQLVETRQSTKAISQILKKSFQNTDLIFVKAKLVSKFRHDYKMWKIRELNDLHHGQDAFLNIVVGNVFDTKFTKNPLNFVKNAKPRSYSLNQMFNYDVARGDNVAWVAPVKGGDPGSIVSIRKTLAKNDLLFTRYAYTQKGGFFDQNLVKKGKGQFLRKADMGIDKYGGYNKVSGAYFFLVEHLKKGEKVKTFEFIPVVYMNSIQSDKDLLIYTKDKLRLEAPRILAPRIKINALFSVNGFRMHLSGRTGAKLIFKGANQLFMNGDLAEDLRKVLKFIQKKRANSELVIGEKDKITKEKNEKLYEWFVKKLKSSPYQYNHTLSGSQYQNLIEGRSFFLSLPIENQCIVIGEILKLFQCNSLLANLNLIEGGASCGILTLSSTIGKDFKYSLIDQSVTGYYEKEINLLEL